MKFIKSPGLRANNIAGELNVSDVTIRRDMQKLFKKGIVEFKDSKKIGRYYITTDLRAFSTGLTLWNRWEKDWEKIENIDFVSC